MVAEGWAALLLPAGVGPCEGIGSLRSIKISASIRRVSAAAEGVCDHSLSAASAFVQITPLLVSFRVKMHSEG